MYHVICDPGAKNVITCRMLVPKKEKRDIGYFVCARVHLSTLDVAGIEGALIFNAERFMRQLIAAYSMRQKLRAAIP